MPSTTFEALRRSAAQSLSEAGIGDAETDARLMLMAACECSRADIIARAHEIVSIGSLEHFNALLKRRMSHEPMAYILSVKEFWSLPFKVTQDVLIPRPETEGVVQRALALMDSSLAPDILDIGTGSGAILISLLCEMRGARGVGVDISKAALAIARQNALALGVADRAAFIRSNFLVAVEGQFDVLVSNPPYISDYAMAELPKDVKDYEPSLALRGGACGLQAYTAIVTQARGVLKPQGHIVFEIGFDQADALADLLEQNRFSSIEIFKDLAGHDRVVSAKNCENK